MIRLAIAAAILAFAPYAEAQEPDCDNAVTQTDMNICATLDFENADRDLNVIWKQAMAAAKATDSDLDGDLKGAAKALLSGQRGWIDYRDGQCALAGYFARGGTMESMLVSDCMAEMTRARTKELRDYVAGDDR